MATYYIDPTWSGNKSGTFAAPYSAYSSLPALSAGDFVLQKAGTTATENVTAGYSGTSGNPITYGVYNATTGAQITSTVGAATISGTASIAHNFSTGGQSFVEVVGFAATNIKDSSVYGFRLGHNSASSGGNAARYCSVTSQTCAAGFLVFTNAGTVGHTVDHCVSSNNIGYGIIIAQQASGKVTVTNNVCNYNSEAGLRSAFSSAILLSGTVANNDFSYNGTIQAVKGHGIGIDILSDTSDIYIANNTCNSNYTMGIRSGSFSGTSTANQQRIKFNVCNYNGEYGIQAVSSGGWELSSNVCNYNGSNRGDKYGRGIEIVGSATKAAGPGVICYNECSYSYNYGGTGDNGTEGCGIGLDDYHKDVSVYGNLLVGNEGNGISFNPNGASGTNKVYGNVLIDNFCAPSTRASSWAAYVKTQIGFYTTQNNVQVFNNHVIQTTASSCLYGISESNIAAGTGTVVCNNLFQGHVTAMNVRTGITRTNNAFYGNTNKVVSSVDGSTLTDGTGAVTVSPSLDTAYVPTASSVLTGGTFLGGIDFYGKEFPLTCPIGAVSGAPVTRSKASRSVASRTVESRNVSKRRAISSG